MPQGFSVSWYFSLLLLI